nr:transferase [Alphaproteobacteria bacterium]
DLGAMEAVGWSLCPKDAVPRIQEYSDWIIPVDGGMGVIRYLAETLLAEASVA